MFGNAVAALALEGSILAGESFAIDFIRAIRTVTIVVASIAPWNAFAIASATEFGSGAFAVLVLAKIVVFVVAIGAVVLEIASPPTRDAALVFALELGRLVTSRALLRQLVRA